MLTLLRAHIKVTGHKSILMKAALLSAVLVLLALFWMYIKCCTMVGRLDAYLMNEVEANNFRTALVLPPSSLISHCSPKNITSSIIYLLCLYCILSLANSLVFVCIGHLITVFSCALFQRQQQIPRSAWWQWTAAWTRPRRATWTTCASACAQSTWRHASRPPHARASATSPSATRRCAASSTACLPSTPTDCSSARAATERAPSVAARPSCPAAPTRPARGPAAWPRWGPATPIMSAGQSTCPPTFLLQAYNLSAFSSLPRQTAAERLRRPSKQKWN